MGSEIAAAVLHKVSLQLLITTRAPIRAGKCNFPRHFRKLWQNNQPTDGHMGTHREVTLILTNWQSSCHPDIVFLKVLITKKVKETALIAYFIQEYPFYCFGIYYKGFKPLSLVVFWWKQDPAAFSLKRKKIAKMQLKRTMLHVIRTELWTEGVRE